MKQLNQDDFDELFRLINILSLVTCNAIDPGSFTSIRNRCNKLQSKFRRALRVSDFKDHDGPGRWRSYDLETHGVTLDECLQNAIYWHVDQDGESIGESIADDNAAVDYITNWFNGEVK